MSIFDYTLKVCYILINNKQARHMKIYEKREKFKVRYL